MGTISIRLKDKEIEELDELAEIVKIDRTTLLRQLIADAMKKRRKILAFSLYQSGETLEAAAQKAKVNVWDVIDYFESNALVKRFDSDRWEEQTKRILNIQKK